MNICLDCWTYVRDNGDEVLCLQYEQIIEKTDSASKESSIRITGKNTGNYQSDVEASRAETLLKYGK